MECKIDDLTIHYESFGAGYPLLLIHGWPSDHRHIQNDFEPLFKGRENWWRIYPDLPGMGKTRAADWITHQDQMLDILLKFMDHIAPGERFAIAGSSYGAYLVRGIVHHRLDHLDGVAITVPVVKREPAHLPEHRVIKEDAAFLAAVLPEEQDLMNMLTVQSMETLENFRKNFTPAFAMADLGFLEQLRKNYWFSFEVDSLPQPFPAPALILCGRFDHWCGYQDAFQLLDQYPRATYAVLDRASHALGSEQKSLFQALAGEWLDRVEEYQKR